MEIRPLNLDDEAEILRTWDIRLSDRLAVDPGYVFQPPAVLVSTARRGHVGIRVRCLVAEEDGQVIGVGDVHEPADDPGQAWTGAAVAIGRRRRGIGTELLTRVEAMTERPVLLSSYSDEGTDGGAPGFAAHHGYREHARRYVRRLEWPPTPEQLPDVVAPGYEVSAYVGGLPEELVPAYCAFDAATSAEDFHGDAPATELAVNPRLYAERMERMRESGLTRIFGVARAVADGEVVAISDLSYQTGGGVGGTGFTRVAPAHRGRSLGLACKVAAHRALLESGAPVTALMTNNDGLNAPMIAINERVGFRVDRTFISLIKER